MQTPQHASLALASLAALSLVALAPARAQTTIINTLPDQNNAVGPFGVPYDATLGETITAPGATILQDFTFNVDNIGGTTIVADAEVYAWNGTTAIGPALFQSAPFSIPANNAYTLYTAVSNVPVTAGNQYVLLFTTSGLQAGQPTSFSNSGAVIPGTYTGGNIVALNNGDDHSLLTTAAYQQFPGDNLAFRADFGPAPAAPEPSGWATLTFTGLGLAGLLLLARRRNSQKAMTAKQ